MPRTGPARAPLAVLFALLLIAAPFACSGHDGEGQLARELVGRWRWLGSSGGFAGQRSAPTAGEPERTLEIGADGIARFRLDDELTAARRFELREVDSIVHGERCRAIVYISGDPQRGVAGIAELFELSADGRRLTLTQNVYDGFSSSWERVEP